MFIEQFGELYEIITHYKSRGYNQFSIELQKAESNMFINIICNRIFEYDNDIKFFTVHDAIYCKEEHICQIKSIIEEEFYNIGLKPSVDIQPVN